MKKIFILAISIFIPTAVYAEEKLTVFAAASLTNALTEISVQYEKETGVNVAHSFAAASTLAK